MRDPQNRQEYLSHFPGKKQGKALEIAHDVRKFEIDLFWRRGAYFWAFIAAAFAGYFVLRTAESADFWDIYLVAILGFSFSTCWYLVNRGSAAWQKNWENHVDLLEDEVTGPLYKLVVDKRSYRLLDLGAPFSFSPSRLNNLLSLIVTIGWTAIIVRTVFDGGFLIGSSICMGAGLLLVPAVVAVCLVVFGGTHQAGDLKRVQFRIREYG